MVCYRALYFLSFFVAINGYQRCFYTHQAVERTNGECPDTTICNRTLTISYMPLLDPLYVNNPLEQLINMCCGSCAATIQNPYNYSSISNLNSERENETDFVFPVLGPSTSSQRLYGCHFIPYIDAPSLTYITQKDTLYPLAFIYFVFPLFFIVLLMSMVAGFIIWCFETCNNESQFPKPFLIGWFQGTWFCFVSLTIVGYGDKIPKSAAGKLFSVFWMFIGVVIFALTTSLMTSEIGQLTNRKKDVGMKDRKIGIIKSRDYEGYVIAKNGGFTVEIHGNNLSSTLQTLLVKLQRKDIDGVLIDKYTALFLDEHISKLRQVNDTSYVNTINYYFKRTSQTELKHTGRRLSYGFLVKDKYIFDYLNEVIRDNQITIERKLEEAWLARRRLSVKMAPLQQAVTSSLASVLFDSDRSYFENSVIVLLAILGLICLFGIFYEIRRKLQDEKAFYQETNLGN